jgi:hypothetical protein
MTMNIPGPDTIEWLGVHDKTILKFNETGGAISLLGPVPPALARRCNPTPTM